MLKLLERSEANVSLSHDLELEKRCRERLGYSPQSSLKVDEALEKVGCRPFTAESVERYKAKARGPSAVDKRGYISLAVGALVLASLVAGLTLVDVSFWEMGDNAAMWRFVPIAIISLMVSFVSVPLAWGFQDIFLTYVNRRWDLVPVAGYGKPIPEFALQTACDLRSLLPSAEFYVDELIAENEVRKVYDPFLVMKVGGTEQQYYLEVWNEPKYKQERSV